MGVRKELAPMIYITGNSTSSEEIGTDVDYSYQSGKPHELMDVILNHYIISAGNFPSVRRPRNWWVRWCCEVTHLENPQQVLFPYMRYIAAGGVRIKNLPVLLTLPFFEECTVKVDYDDHDYEVRGVFPNVFTIPKRRIGIIGEITLFNSVGFNDEYTAHRHNLLNEIQRKGLLE